MRISGFLRTVLVIAFATPAAVLSDACGKRNDPLRVGELCHSDLRCMAGLICKGSPRRCSQLNGTVLTMQ